MCLIYKENDFAGELQEKRTLRRRRGVILVKIGKISGRSLEFLKNSVNFEELNIRFMKTVKLIFAAVMAMFFMTSCGGGDVKTELFNGRDLTGWVCYTDPAGDVPASDVFSVRDGNLHIEGQPFGYIRTADKYGDYKLHVEWRWAGEPSNSGIFQRLQDGDRLWPTGIECQLCHGSVGDFVMLGGAKISDIECVGKFPVKRRNGDFENPAGEWNTMEIVCEGKTITTYLNGQLQKQCTCETTEGYIALQSEGGPVEFRNVYLSGDSNE